VSPWSIANALAMAGAGAKGDTATEMDKVLHVTDTGAIDAAMNALGLALDADNGNFPSSTGSGTIELTTADRAFLQHDMALVPAYLDTLARYYGAGVGVDYVKATETAVRRSRVVNDETHERIPGVAGRRHPRRHDSPGAGQRGLPRADWEQPFEDLHHRRAVPLADRGRDRSFHAQPGRVASARDALVAVTLPTYVGGQLAMTIVLPDTGRFDDVAGLAEVLSATATGSETAEVNLALPKFDIAFLSSLKQQLQTLGMVKAFDPDVADFSGMTDSQALYVSDVVHGANLTVDEQGTVAAAATAVIVRATSAPLKVETVTVDRPFLFAVRDVSTATVLFVGQVTNPTVPT
jgi:serpin B